MFDVCIQQSVNESVLCWLATVDPEGKPNVSPKEMFVPYEDKYILIANIASPKSAANIKENSFVCVSFIDILKQKGFKLSGIAKLIDSSEQQFETLLKELHKIGGETFPVKSIIKITVTSSEPIIAPSYWLFPDPNELSQAKQAMESYGVAPKNKIA